LWNIAVLYLSINSLNLFNTVYRMTILTIRQKLMTYIADAEDSKVEALYVLLENEMDESNRFVLSDNQFRILEREHELYLKGEGKSYSVEESFNIIKGKREF